MRTTTTRDGVRIVYDDAGSGDTALLCLPGWCIERSVFAPLVARAGVGRRVIALDWRGHGESGRPEGDFGAAALVEDAMAVIEASGVERVVPVAQAHAGWVAIDLAQRLGERTPAIVATSWMMLAPPPPFASVLAGMQNAQTWAATRDKLVAMWLEGGPPAVAEQIRAMTGRSDGEMWGRSAREIAAAFARHGTASLALSHLTPVRRMLHLYAEPRTPEVLAAHEGIARENAWFRFRRLRGVTHFPTLETPDEVLTAIGDELAI
jgi:pimeloyl-ACP methyl ester carboxylesterase